jgi:DNA mismatch repair protein MutS
MHLAVALLLNPILALANRSTQESLIKHISNQFLISTFGEVEIEVTPTTNTNANFIEKIKQQIDPKKQLLTPRETQETAFAIVSSNYNFDTDIIDSSCIDKLEIILGGENNTQHLFGNIFKHINTTSGKAYAALTFCHPTSDINTLQNRQQAIINLHDQTRFLQRVDISLKKISSFEAKSHMFWHTKPAVNQELLKFSYFGQQFDVANILKTLNTNTAALEITNKTYSVISCAIGTFYFPALFAWTVREQAKAMNLPFSEIKKAIIKELGALPPAAKVGIIIPVALQGLMIYSTAMSLQSSQEMYNHLQNILIVLSSHITELKKVGSLINKNKELIAYLPSLQPLADFNNTAKHSANLNKLLGMLDTNTFQGESSFFSITGRVLAAYELMKQVKDELAPAFAAAGELDMYVALAKLYAEHKNKTARYCLVNFLENNTAPVIEAERFWNPFINADTVIVNDIAFDGSCPNSILTGPNTGGKSTVIKAIMLNVLMAQTFGMAPSASLTITPFSKLNCFMNISDDIATGASLFKSEVMRAKKLLDLVQSLKKNEFSFVIIDEVFTGTSPKEGEQAALGFAKKVGSYSNNISIIATHYPKMVDLETEINSYYRNHHVEILRNEDGSLHRTFKLKNGPTFMNVAFDILEEEGLFV